MTDQHHVELDPYPSICKQLDDQRGKGKRNSIKEAQTLAAHKNITI